MKVYILLEATPMEEYHTDDYDIAPDYIEIVDVFKSKTLAEGVRNVLQEEADNQERTLFCDPVTYSVMEFEVIGE